MLQNAIWWLEGEGGSTNAYTALPPRSSGIAIVNAKLDASAGMYGVYVLNNYSNAARTAVAQDFLYRVPDGGTTLALLGGALMGLGLLRRKLSI